MSWPLALVLLYSVAILARLDMKISEIFSHRDKYLRHEQEDLLHLLMENQHWERKKRYFCKFNFGLISV